MFTYDNISIGVTCLLISEIVFNLCRGRAKGRNTYDCALGGGSLSEHRSTDLLQKKTTGSTSPLSVILLSIKWSNIRDIKMKPQVTNGACIHEKCAAFCQGMNIRFSIERKCTHLILFARLVERQPGRASEESCGMDRDTY